MERTFEATGAVGAQLYVAAAGESVIDAGYGAIFDGSPLDKTHLHKVWCATKPLLGHYVVTRYPLDLVIADVVQQFGDGLGSTRLEDLLAHQAGLVRPGLADVLFLPPSERVFTPTPSPELLGRTCYSEFLSWYVLCRLVLETEGVSAESVVSCNLETKDLTSEIFVSMDDKTYSSSVHRIGTYFSVRPDREPAPWLHDRTSYCCTADTNCALGGIASMHGLGKWYAGLLADGFCPIELGHSADASGQPSFYAGFMIGLCDHGFGTFVSPLAFGQVGWLGTSFAFGDPASGLVVAFLCNTLFDSSYVRRFRSDLVDAIHRDLGIVA